MEDIMDEIGDFIEEMLEGWVLTNLEKMFATVNDKVGTIAGEVGQTPSTWNSDILSLIRGLSDDVMVPIAGIIITFVLCYELIHMVMDKNNMHDFDTSLFFRYLLKAFVAVWLVSNTHEITMAVFDLGSHAVTSAGARISSDTAINVHTAIISMFNATTGMSIGELLVLGIETTIINLGMKIMSVIITIVLYGRMIEIYFYISIAPIPYATWTNKEWGSIGTNYFKNLIALAFQGFFIMVCVGIYSVLIASITVNPVDTDIHEALWHIVAYTVLLCFSLLKTGSLSKSIFNAH